MSLTPEYFKLYSTFQQLALEPTPARLSTWLTNNFEVLKATRPELLNLVLEHEYRKWKYRESGKLSQELDEIFRTHRHQSEQNIIVSTILSADLPAILLVRWFNLTLDSRLLRPLKAHQKMLFPVLNEILTQKKLPQPLSRRALAEAILKQLCSRQWLPHLSHLETLLGGWDFTAIKLSLKSLAHEPEQLQITPLLLACSPECLKQLGSMSHQFRQVMQIAFRLLERYGAEALDGWQLILPALLKGAASYNCRSEHLISVCGAISRRHPGSLDASLIFNLLSQRKFEHLTQSMDHALSTSPQ